MLDRFILALNVFEFLIFNFLYVFGTLYLVFQLLYTNFHISHTVFLCRIMSSNQKRLCKWVACNMTSFIKLQWQ